MFDEEAVDESRALVHTPKPLRKGARAHQLRFNVGRRLCRARMRLRYRGESETSKHERRPRDVVVKREASAEAPLDAARNLVQDGADPV